jgi:BCD family chlorophyll transporter-like MFS transporter
MGLYIGAWGMANAISRLLGSVIGGALRDVIGRVSGQPVIGYMVVFGIMALIMLASLVMLRGIDVRAFQRRAESDASLLERAAMASD